ncbi:MAG: NBR1-Ig-like domain-containing protein [Anaerolineales bacterium]|nr:NBR1-Ig-like domain-containing protein [Anaerolineales bacterium]
MAVTIAAPVAGVENTILPTPTVACTNSLLFIADQTIPDGTEVERGAILDKIWEVENNGTCNYDERYRLKLIGGSELGAKPEQALYPARSGTQFQIYIRFIAPQEAGTVRSAWQAFDPQGNPFGDPIYLEVLVK